jgi:peptidoglycan/LPS O-acetylase OafA/YrhL
MTDIKALTGLRGMAAILVVAYHFFPTANISETWVKYTIGRGYIWVDLFFVLSGYVMALNYGKMFTGGFSRAAFAEFLVRRIARIYPLYIVLLGAQLIYTVIVYGSFHQSIAWPAVTVGNPVHDIPANILLVQSLAVSPSILGQAWSISTELAAYLAFPALVALVFCNDRRLITATALVAVTLLVGVVVINMQDGAYHSGSLDAYDGTRITPLMRCLGEFLCGMLTFRLNTMHRLVTVASYDSVSFMTLAVLIVMLVTGAPDLAVAAMFPALVLCLSQNSGLFAAVFSNVLMYGLGIISYAMYLLHPLLQQPRERTEHMMAAYFPHDVAVALSMLLATVILLLISVASYNGIEVPGRRAVRRLSGRLSQQRALADG